MINTNYLSIVSNGESLTTEFKQSFDKEAIETTKVFEFGAISRNEIFDNSITIFNPGKLYGDMTIEKLRTENYQAQTRNKLITEAFYLTNDTEKYGSGYGRVRGEIATYPTMKLEYEEMGNGYLVTISYEKQKVSSDESDK